MARPIKNPVDIEKICPVCNLPFKIEFRLRNRRTYCSKTCSNRDPRVINKMIKSQNATYEKKYGMHPMQTNETKERLKTTVRSKYGVDWFSESDEWNKKVNKSNLETYGSEWYVNPDKTKETCLEKYGVSNFRNTEEYAEKYKKTCLERYGVPHASKHSTFTIQHYKTMFDRFLNHPKFQNFKALFSFDEYKGVFVKKYKFECRRCNVQKEHSLEDGRGPVCVNCDKLNISTFQKDVYDYVISLLGNTIDIQMDNRTILNPKELDIVIPSSHLAIECNGLVWHSEVIGRKNKLYHLQKTNVAACSGYRLIHIFDNEWESKNEVIKSILASALGKVENKINGRKCEVKEIDAETACAFIEKNHLQGADHSTIKLGLFHNDELVSVMTFVKSRFDSKIEWEMSRYCNKLRTMIHGGASKLFSHFIKTYSPKTIVSYSDRRYFDGTLYLNLGFQFVYNSPPSYYYIIDNYLTIQNRMSWQKHKLQGKLPVFDPTISEWENMKNNGFDRIWDCGHSKWIWNPSS